MKLNLGCGTDHKEGYLNVDFRKLPGVDIVADLSSIPWAWMNGQVDEIMMLDFLEHFPYARTEAILQECWRILKPGGKLIVQVPDLEHCARAASFTRPYLCNRCGWEFQKRAGNEDCGRCGQSSTDVALAAAHRLMGGQDYEGNWHYALFSTQLLYDLLRRNGFRVVDVPERNENGETYFQNWNVRLDAVKGDLDW